MKRSIWSAWKPSAGLLQSLLLRSAPILLFLVSLICYLTTLTRVHTFDALSYVLDVDRKPWQELFHPHHLAYGPLGAFVRHVVTTFDWHTSTRIPLQWTNAVAGALGVAVFFALVHDVTRRVDLAVCGALLLGSGYAYWYYAVEVEVYTIATLFLVLSLWLMVVIVRRPSLRVCVALGIVQGLSVLFHQTNVLLCLPVAAALLLACYERDGANNRWWDKFASARFRSGMLAYGLPLGIIVAGSYAFVGFGVSGFHSWDQFVEWMTAYARTGWWGGTITAENWTDLGTGLADTIAQPGGALLGMLLMGLVVLYLRRLIHIWRIVACLIGWLVSYGAFFFWWEPDNIEFWIASLPPAILLIILALHVGGAPWHPGVWVALAVGGTMLGVNYEAITRRGEAAYDLQRRIANVLAQHSAPGDLLLVPDGMQELYLPYYEERDNVYSLNQALFHSDADWARACTLVRSRIHTTLERGFAVVIGEDVLHPASRQIAPESTVLERFNLSPEQVTQCFTPYLPDLEQLEMGASLPVYYRLPSSQELVASTGWTFTRHRWGWQATNIRAERFASAWEFLPQVDPRLVSPPLQIRTERYVAVEVRMAATTEARDAQLFFVDEEGNIAEARSVRWTLQPGSEVRTYRVDLRGRPGWSGIVSGLRLDPVGVGDGGWVWVESLRLIPRSS